MPGQRPARRLRLLAPLLLFAACATLPAAQRTPEEARKVAESVLARAIIIDTHADTPQVMLDENYDLADPAGRYMVSIPKMRAGHLSAEFFSIWVDVKWPAEDLIHRALDLIDAVNEQVAQHSRLLAPARTAADVRRLHAQKKLAALFGIEGGHIIENDLRVLNIFYKLGVRYMTLTHTANTDWADSSADKPRWNGLTDFGRRVVHRMNRLGMMVDISHVSDKTFYDVLATTRAPVIASHSSCRALCDAPRNMTDDMLRALARNGGAVNINFYSAFVDQAYREAHNKISAREDAETEVERQRLARQGKRLTFAQEVAIHNRFEPALPTPSFERIADHIEHAAKVAGVEHVGLGSDFDGVHSIPRGMEDASKIPNLVHELARRGFSEQDLEKILGGNMLRVMSEVESAARKLQTGKENRR